MSLSIESNQQWTIYNPATGEPVAQYFHSSKEEIETGLHQLENEYRRFRKLAVFERTEGIHRLGVLLKKHKNALALLMAQEMGKPIQQGRAEIEKCAVTCAYYAEMGEKIVMSQEVSAHYGQTWIVKRPLGIILAVMPWNFPFWQVIRCAVPAWLSGNVVLLKHAPTVQGCARWIQELVQEAFGSTPLLQLPMTNEQTEQIIGDSRIKAVSFTGSSQVGRRLASLSGAHLKKTVLELGGSDPYIVLADADLELAVQLCVKARFINSGQSCVAAKRFFIHQSVYEDFKVLAVEHVKRLCLGDPADEKTEIGPMAEERLRQGVLRQLAKSLDLGAQIVIGGAASETILGGKGFFVEPTIVENVTSNMPVMAEECFGPIMPLMPISSLEHGVFLANQTNFGLGAALFTRRPDLAWPIASEDLEAGMVVINDSIQSDPRVPFGGIKDSGWGRELGSQGVLEFVNLKTVGIAKGFF